MAVVKISELVAASTPLTGEELMEVSQDNGGLESRQTTTTDVSFAGAQYGSFYDTTDQTGDIAAATAAKFGTDVIANRGVTVASFGGNATRITYAKAGDYMLAVRLQFANSDAADQDVTVWLAKNGVAIAASATKYSVPKTGDGGALGVQIAQMVTVAASDYIEVMWLPENVAVTLDNIAAGAIAPAIPSARVVTQRINQ